jgi:ceramide glucosyltransferase
LLADDFYIGRMVADHGYDVRISSAIVTTVGEDRRFADFWNRQIRWHRTYRNVRPASMATIVIQGPFWALILLLASGGGILSAFVLMVVVAARIAMAFILARDVLQLGVQARDALWVPLKDLLAVVIWCASLASNTVEWGGRRLRIRPDGTMSELHV